MRSKPKAAKKPSRKTKQLQSGNGKKPKPKFYRVLDACVAARERRLTFCRKQMGRCCTDDSFFNELIERAENELNDIEACRQRYERYQADRKVPLKLRNEIASVETDILQDKFRYNRTNLDYRLGFTRYSVTPSQTGKLYALFAKVDRIENPVRTENRLFKVGQCYPILRLKKAYDTYVCEVLRDHLDAASESGKEKIVSPLPKKAEYLELKDRFYTRTLADLADEAYYGLLNLRRDVEEKRISMEKETDCEERDVPETEYEEFFQWEKDLGGIIADQPVLPACVSQLPIVFHPETLDEPALEIGRLRAVAEAIQSYRGSGPELTEAEAKALDESYQRLRDHADKMETFVWPSSLLESDD